MKVIAFSLWGEDTRYTLGAIQNASLAKIVYPGWVCRFYIGKSVPQNIVDLLSEFDNVEIIMLDEEGDWTGMFWRFKAASDPEVDVLISRDVDSRLWFREKAAVDEWLESGKPFHIMRDNEQHCIPICGGMWGVRGGVFPNMPHAIKKFLVGCLPHDPDGPPIHPDPTIWNEVLKSQNPDWEGNYWQIDQNFLRQEIYPQIAHNATVHDEFFDKKPFPTPRDPLHFVGQAYAGCGRILDGEEYFQDFMRREYDAQK